MPVYESVARVDINPSQTTNIGISDLMDNKMGGDTPTRLLTQVRILQSDSVIYAVIDSQNLYNKEPFSRNLQDHPVRTGQSSHPVPAGRSFKHSENQPEGRFDSEYRPG